MKLKTDKEIEILKEGGRHLASILNTLSKKVVPGVSVFELDLQARGMIKDVGAEPSFLNYKPKGVTVPYPAALCVSVNEEIVHGIPTKEKKIKDGDVVTLDCGLKYKGMFTDMAITFAVGSVSPKIKKLIEVTRESLYKGIEKALVGNKVGDISNEIGSYIKKNGFTVIEGLAGHGVGYAVHEEPFVPNDGKKNTGVVLKEGAVLAIEPMASLGAEDIIGLDDQFTFVTSDDSISAHFEHTVAVTKDGPVIITKID